ncbi:MAG: RNA polymerase sigma factor [Ruminococcaceae bacterium]|nr:RNA polymerase sigma factor [Oscillospiraceae bacterium]
MVEKEELIRIVTSAQQGDESGAAALYSTFYNDIYYFILKTVSDPELAADLTQDTFMEILQTIRQLKEPAAFVTWSRQIAYHRCTAHFRKRKELLADEDEDGYSVFDTIEEERTEFIPDAALDQADLKATIHAMIASLPEEQKSALLMRYFEELSVSQIAEVQGVSEGTVKSRLNYGRKAIGKAVEDYEKKNGVKLHCVGIVPLLLWLASQGTKKSAAGMAGAGAAAAGTVGAASAAGTAASGTAAVGAAATSVASGLAIKVAVGITALALAIGGITAAVLSQNDDESDRREPVETQQILEDPMEWYGYGSDRGVNNPRYFEMSVSSLTDTEITGHLEVSHLYEISHDTDFTGTGSENDDGTVQYDLRFETPVTMGVSSYEYWQMTMTYDPETEEFTFDCDYYVTLARRRAEPKEVILSEDAVWTGGGTCDFCYGSEAVHIFSLDIEKMTDTGISGVLTVTRDGVEEHTSAFTGRGYLTETGASYEIRLKNPKTDIVWMSERTVEIFWMHYDNDADTLNIEDITYSASCSRGNTSPCD